MISGAGLLLVAAAVGYWVLERAETHKGNLRRVGQCLGWVIIFASLIGVACRVWYGAGPWCPMGKASAPMMTPASPAVAKPK